MAVSIVSNKLFWTPSKISVIKNDMAKKQNRFGIPTGFVANGEKIITSMGMIGTKYKRAMNKYLKSKTNQSN